MKVAIVGAGAMGSLFGGLLHEAGAEVWLIDIWAEHVAAINANGLQFEDKGETRSIGVRATTDAAEAGSADLTIVFVKSTATAIAAKTAAALAGDDGVVLSLQNGMGNADAISAEVDPARVLTGTTTHGATMLGPGAIKYAGAGATTIGAWGAASMDRVERVAELLTKAAIETEATEDIRPVVWNKLLINVGINAITALTGIKNGQLLDLDSTKEISRLAVEEAMAVARARNIAVNPEAVEVVYKVAGATGPNRSSMGQDVDAARQTEITAINGFIVRQAAETGVAAPVNTTLTALIETLQHHYK